jgi:hypothetical protein
VLFDSSAVAATAGFLDSPVADITYPAEFKTDVVSSVGVGVGAAGVTIILSDAMFPHIIAA